MKRVLLAGMLLVTACREQDAPTTLQPKVEGGETYEIKRFGPGDSLPIPLKGGNYRLAMFPRDGCTEPMRVKMREDETGEVILETTENSISRTLTEVKPGVYVINVVMGKTSCAAYLSLLPDQPSPTSP